MARKAANPGVGKGHGTRARREFTCVDCGSTFLAARSDAMRCQSCWGVVRRASDHRTVSPGVGTGHGIRPRRTLICVDCGVNFEAVRSDAKRCTKCGNTRQARYENRAKGACAICDAPIVRRAVLCLSCRAKTRTGEKSPSWKGGISRDKSGYVKVRTERPDRRTPYELEHRVLWERAYGPLPKWHIIHHLNGIKSDNRLENLAAMSRADHHTKHAEPYEARIRALEARIRELEGSM